MFLTQTVSYTTLRVNSHYKTQTTTTSLAAVVSVPSGRCFQNSGRCFQNPTCYRQVPWALPDHGCGTQRSECKGLWDSVLHLVPLSHSCEATPQLSRQVAAQTKHCHHAGGPVHPHTCRFVCYILYRTQIPSKTCFNSMPIWISSWLSIFQDSLTQVQLKRS